MSATFLLTSTVYLFKFEQYLGKLFQKRHMLPALGFLSPRLLREEGLGLLPRRALESYWFSPDGVINFCRWNR